MDKHNNGRRAADEEGDADGEARRYRGRGEGLKSSRGQHPWGLAGAALAGTARRPAPEPSQIRAAKSVRLLAIVYFWRHQLPPQSPALPRPPRAARQREIVAGVGERWTFFSSLRNASLKIPPVRNAWLPAHWGEPPRSDRQFATTSRCGGGYGAPIGDSLRPGVCRCGPRQSRALVDLCPAALVLTMWSRVRKLQIAWS